MIKKQLECRFGESLDRYKYGPISLTGQRIRIKDMSKNIKRERLKKGDRSNSKNNLKGHSRKDIGSPNTSKKVLRKKGSTRGISNRELKEIEMDLGKGKIPKLKDKEKDDNNIDIDKYERYLNKIEKENDKKKKKE